MMDFPALKGNEKAKNILAGRSFHACLIEGPEGEAREALVSFAVLRMLCSSADAPCGTCRNCRKFLSGNHPDVVTIDAYPVDEKNPSKRRRVSTEEMRRALSGLLLLPNEAAVRVYVIRNAQELSELVQNILLKPIEEPPPHVAFLIVSDRAEALLETIRSRCCILTVEDFQDQGSSENVAAFLDSIAAGIYSDAESFLDFTGREAQKIFFRDCLREVRRRLLTASEERREEAMSFYGRLEKIFSSVVFVGEYNINIKLWNTVLLARCFR